MTDTAYGTAAPTRARQPTDSPTVERLSDGAQGVHATAQGALGKRYGELWALRDLDLSVPAGSVLGLLGHNGAGKTTTLRLLTTLARPTTGSATVAGFDVVAAPERVRSRIGVAGAGGDRRRAALRARQPRDDRPPLPPGGAAGSRARRRAARALRARRRRGAAREDLLRRHAPPPRPGREPGGLTAGALPRRADDRPRPGRPPRAVGAARRAGPRRDHARAHDPVPRGGRPARRPDRRARPRPRRGRRLAGRAQVADRRRAGRGDGRRARPSSSAAATAAGALRATVSPTATPKRCR